MKKILVSITVISLFAGLANLSTQAVNADRQERGQISVNTSASAEVAPDVAEISFTVLTSDSKSMQKATIQNKEISDRVYSELKSFIDTSKGDYIKTSNYSAQPIYSYVNSKKILDKYQVSNKVIVHTKSIDKVGKMIDNAISSGATNVDNLSFSLSNYESQCDSLIIQASKKAKNRADAIAKSMLSSVDGISNISTSCSANNNYYQPRYYMAKSMLTESAAGNADVAEPETVISNGVIKINANVNAIFFVK